MKNKNIFILIITYLLFVLLSTKNFTYLYTTNINYNNNLILTLVLNILIPILTIALLYYFLNNKVSSKISFISTLLFIYSSYLSLTYSNYEKTLSILLIVLSLIGIDKKSNNHKSLLLMISIFLLIILNKNNLITKLFPLLIYSLYININKEHISLKTILKSIYNILLPVLISLFISSIFILPDILTNEYNLFTKASPMGLGLSIILIPSIINNFKNKDLILINILLIISFFLPIDLIYYLPIYILLISQYIKDILNNKISKLNIILTILLSTIIIIYTKNINYLIYLYIYLITLFLYTKTKLINIFYLLLIPLLINTYYINKDTYFITIKEYKYNINTIKELSNNIDKDIYIELDNNNLLDLISNNREYVITRNYLPIYKLIKSINGINLYYNKNTLPLYYGTSNLLTYEEYNNLSKPSKYEALLNNIITENNTTNNYISHIQKEDNITKPKLLFTYFNNKESIYYANKITYKNTYTLDYSYLERFNIYKFNINKEESNKNRVIGSINMDKEGYFIIKKDYHNIYNIVVDNQSIEYEKVNNNNIGFYLKEGYHDISITYKTSIIIMMLFLTIIGIIFEVVIIVLQYKRKI